MVMGRSARPIELRLISAATERQMSNFLYLRWDDPYGWHRRAGPAARGKIRGENGGSAPIRGGAASGDAEGMDSDVTILLGIAAVWLAAGLLAEGLPGRHTVRALRRHTALLLVLTVAGLAGIGAVVLAGLVAPTPTLADRAAVGLALPAVPALLAAVVTVHRLRRLRAGTGAFAKAPGIPPSPAARAAAAHPMIALPVQTTGLATLPALVTAAGLAPLTGPGLLGVVLTAAVVAVGAIGVRLALRHDRLRERAVTLRPGSPRASRILHV